MKGLIGDPPGAHYNLGYLSAGIAYEYAKRSFSEAFGSNPNVGVASDAMPRYKRRRTGGRRSKEASNQIADYTHGRTQWGRFMGSGRIARRALLFGVNKVQMGFENNTLNFGSTGFYTLSAHQTALGSPLSCPLFAISLTNIINVQNYGAVAAVAPPTVYKMSFTTQDTNTYKVVSTAESRSNLNFLDSEVARNTTVSGIGPNDVGYQKTLLDWVKMRFVFYCPTKIPTEIRLSLVQFKRDDLNPDNISVAGTGGSNSFAATSYYASITRPDMFSMCSLGSSDMSRYVQVLWHDKFILNPKESTDPANTTYRQYDAFWRLNRKCTYDWAPTDRPSLIGEDLNSIQTGGQNQTEVVDQARLWLLVQARTKYQVAATADAGLIPSFDLAYKKQFTTL